MAQPARQGGALAELRKHTMTTNNHTLRACTALPPDAMPRNNATATTITP